MYTAKEAYEKALVNEERLDKERRIKEKDHIIFLIDQAVTDGNYDTWLDYDLYEENIEWLRSLGYKVTNKKYNYNIKTIISWDEEVGGGSGEQQTKTIVAE